jgi:hypothetical protein
LGIQQRDHCSFHLRDWADDLKSSAISTVRGKLYPMTCIRRGASHISDEFYSAPNYSNVDFFPDLLGEERIDAVHQMSELQ